MTLTKDKLIIQIQNQINLTKPESRQLIEQLLEIMKTTLANGEDVVISGFDSSSTVKCHFRRLMRPNYLK